MLVDRVPLPRSKVCGCCLTPAAVRTLQSLQLHEAVLNASPISRLHLLASVHSAVLRISPYIAISREALDTRLARAACSAGAHLLWPASASIGLDGAIQIETPSGTVELRSAAIIVADGIGGSSLKSHKTTQWRIRRKSRIGAGATVNGSPIALSPDEIAMVCHRAGYVGLVRLPDGRTDIAAALSPAALRAAGGLSPLVTEILSTVGGDPEPLRSASWRGTATLTRERAAVEHENILIVGDAAAYVEPFTGEGMTWAIESGAAVVPHALALMEGSYRRGDWARARKSLLGRRQFRCTLIAAALRVPTLVSLAVRLASARPAMASRLARRFGARVEHAAWSYE